MKNVAPAYFTALGTQSSASTIPIALNCAYNNNINNDVADFVVPLCATINLNGDTICLVPVSYTHLDVYKRQHVHS